MPVCHTIRPSLTIRALALLLCGLLSACQNAAPIAQPTRPGLFYLAMEPSPTVVLLDNPAAAPRQRIPLTPPSDCTLYALRPAPLGPWIAVEWECAYGPSVELLDTSSGSLRFALSNPRIDSRFLAWQADGRALYLKIGTLSVPQTLRMDPATGKATELFISPFAYDLTGSPGSDRLLYSLSKGIGFGSETWLAGPDGQNPSQMLLEAQSIIALAQYSPDGSQIAFIKFADDQNTAPPGELWLMDSGGFNTRRLASADAGRGLAPVWAPDGAKIAFIERVSPDAADDLRLALYDLASGTLTRAPLTFRTATQPAWAPDGNSILLGAVSSGSAQTGGDTMDVWLYELSSGQVSKLASGACCAGWIR